MNKENKAIFYQITYKTLLTNINNGFSIVKWVIAGLFVISNAALSIPFVGIFTETSQLITGNKSFLELTHLMLCISILYLPIISNQIINTYEDYKSKNYLTLFDVCMIPFNNIKLDSYFIFYPYVFTKIIFLPSLLTNRIFTVLTHSNFMNKPLISNKKLELTEIINQNDQ